MAVAMPVAKAVLVAAAAVPWWRSQGLAVFRVPPSRLTSSAICASSQFVAPWRP